jgi:catechol 2,3-dioxygenase-like lactoylglutathione lyase family enzyme
MEVSMTSIDASGSTSAQMPEAGTIDMKLEVVTLPVSDIDRAKRFYQSLGWRLDADIAVGDAFRVVQLTPTQSACSVAFGKGVTTGEPGSVQRLILAVDDIDAARADLVRRGIEVSGLFHLAGGPSPVPTRKAAPTRPTPRSSTQRATDGCSRRSRRGYQAGSGNSLGPARRGRVGPVKSPGHTVVRNRAIPVLTGACGECGQVTTITSTPTVS